MFNPEAADMNLINWLVLMFNSETQLRRNWRLKDYYDMLRDLHDYTNIDQIVAWSSKDMKLRNAGMAAGLFSDIASFGGGLIGKVFGHPEIGQKLGGYLGGKADDFLGTGGVNVSGLDTLGKSGLIGRTMGMSGGSYAGRRGRDYASAASYQ
jgi:hypothetical protein